MTGQTRRYGSWIRQNALDRPDSIIPGIRFNDGRVDRRGRFWSGTMVEDPQCTASGSLYSVDGTAEIRCHVRGIRISNGLCMSPDGTRLYFADSPTRTIFVYKVIEPEGSLGPRQVFAHTPDGAQPDGAAVESLASPPRPRPRGASIPTCWPDCGPRVTNGSGFCALQQDLERKGIEPSTFALRTRRSPS